MVLPTTGCPVIVPTPILPHALLSRIELHHHRPSAELTEASTIPRMLCGGRRGCRQQVRDSMKPGFSTQGYLKVYGEVASGARSPSSWVLSTLTPKVLPTYLQTPWDLQVLRECHVSYSLYSQYPPYIITRIILPYIIYNDLYNPLKLAKVQPGKPWVEDGWESDRGGSTSDTFNGYRGI